ncbi:tetratricopeptide repeat protein [Methylocystis sp. JAN1]|uniref:tetratricopeptide repeat protein n=1 Tax=Methylocystis sp. JAN1 TaxID=3397211 RepID=UPI003FA34024
MRTIGGFLILIALACGGPAGAQVDEPPALGDDENGGNFLFIPGIGKIPLPPGVRGYGPGNPPDLQDSLAPRRLGPNAANPPPEPPKSPEERQAQELARLFDRMRDADDERESQSAGAAILRRWSQSGSDTVDLLAARALAAEAAGAPALAKALLDYVVALSPNWPEGFVRRARVMASEGDVAGALADLETAARIEPKRFDALEALGALSEKAGDKKRALSAYRKALEIEPRNDSLHKNAERLRIEVEGRDI